MPLLDASGRPMRPSASADTSVTGVDVTAAYEGAGRRGPMIEGWNAFIRSADREWLPQRNSAVARARDLVRNEPVAASAVKRRRNSAVGRGWRLSSRPNARALGVSVETARELGAQIEMEFKAYAYGHAFMIDAERRLTFGQLLGLAAGHDVMDGEVLALTEWAEDEGTRYKTRLRICDPDRLSNPQGRSDDVLMRGGVERNRSGVPIRYWLRETHPSDVGYNARSYVWTGYERFTAWGRPQVLHVFAPDRAGQTRGVSRFAASLKHFRSLSRFTDATLQAATVHAFMVAFAKSNGGPAAISEALSVEDAMSFEQARDKHYEDHPIELANGVRIPVLPYGDEIQLQSQSKDVTSFDVFTRSIIRLIAASLGVTYEELTMDYSQTNYSSARAAFVPAWAETVEMSSRLEAQLVRPFFVAWLEEAIDRGYIVTPAGAPDFYDAIDAYAEAKWIGPGRGYIDPTKEIDAAAARIEAGISTLEDECAEQGKDWEEVQEQRAREQTRAAELGLPDPHAADANAAAARNPFRDAALDQAPPPAATSLIGRIGSALSRVRATARSDAHAAALEQRAA